MFGRRYMNRIYGTVFVDENNNGKHDNLEPVLKGIGINLFFIDEFEHNHESNSEIDISVLQERQILKTRTNDKGQFSFLVFSGKYSISIDLDTVPSGKGVLTARKVINTRDRRVVDFAVRTIASVEIGNQIPESLRIDDQCYINSIVRDEAGNILAAKIDFSSDCNEMEFSSDSFCLKPASLMDRTVTVALEGGNVRNQYQINFFVPEISQVEKVELAYRLGIIDEHRRISCLLRSLFDRSKLLTEYRSRIPVKSGTGAVAEIQNYITRPDANKEVVEEARRYIASSIPKLDKVYQSPGGFFNIHYTLSGENAVSGRERKSSMVPGYIQQIGTAFDNVKAITCGNRGFKQPILDDGKTAMDIYVYDLKGKYGVTFISNYFVSKSTKARIASSYICIDNNYSADKGFVKSREECMKVTVAHEFFHAVQNAYTVEADTWWKEATATWNEDEIYYGINDYVRYLDRYFSAPQKPLNENSYSGVVFAKYLSENHGGYDVIKRIWEAHASAYKNSLNAIDKVLKEMDEKEDLGVVFNRFTACSYNPEQYYKEGSSWNTTIAIQNTYNGYPVATTSGKLKHLSSNYQLFKPTQQLEEQSLRITVDGSDEVRWGFKLQSKYKNDKKCSITEINSRNPASRTEIVIKNFANYDEICFIPANLEKDQDGVQYNYSANIQ